MFPVRYSRAGRREVVRAASFFTTLAMDAFWKDASGPRPPRGRARARQEDYRG